MIEHCQRQTGKVAKRPQQVHPFQKRWAEISWAKGCRYPQHATEQSFESFDPHKGRAFYRQEDRRHNAGDRGSTYCTKFSDSTLNFKCRANRGRDGFPRSQRPLGKHKAVCKSFHRGRKNFADREKRRLLGHSNPSTTDLYIAAGSPQRLKAAYDPGGSRFPQSGQRTGST